MGKPSTLPSQATSNAADQAQSHLPTSLPPTPVTPTAAPSSNDVTLPQQGFDAVEHMNVLGVNHLPDFFFPVG